MTTETWRPIAYITTNNDAVRDKIARLLERYGWTVITQPTGFHLIQAIADVIEGDAAWKRPSLIVTDVWSRGCAGATIAAGLRDLGITIPIVLVGADAEPVPTSPDDRLRVVDAGHVEATVCELAKLAPPRDRAPPLLRAS